MTHTWHEGLRRTVAHKYALRSFHHAFSSGIILYIIGQIPQIVMSSFSPLPLGLLQALKSSSLKPQLNEKHHPIFPIGLILGLIVICATVYFSSPYRKLPPGPRGYPIIGNILELRSGQWLKFAEWRKKYGRFSHNS